MNSHIIGEMLADAIAKKDWKLVAMSHDAAACQPTKYHVPLKSEGFYAVTEEQINDWSSMWSREFVLDALAKIIAWNQSVEPRDRKTRRGVRKHIVGWMLRDWEKYKAAQRPGDDVRRVDAGDYGGRV